MIYISLRNACRGCLSHNKQHFDSMDGETQFLRKGNKSQSKPDRSKDGVNRALATSGSVDVLKKNTASTNSQHGGPSLNLAKLENETEVFKVNTVSKSVSKTIMQARQDKGMTQKQLATAINEKPQVIQEFESGKAIPDQNVLGKLERTLNVRLRGTNIGAPLRLPK